MIRIALVGAGRIGGVHARHLAGIKEARIVGVYDPLVERSTSIARELDARIAQDWQTLVAADDVDAVVIASSTETHPDVLRMAVSAGKAVYCEKPIAAGLVDAWKLQQDILSQPHRVMVGFNRRFDRNHSIVASDAHAGRIGKLQTVQMTSRGPNAVPNADYLRVSGNLFFDKMVHFFDLARWFTREDIVQVSAMGSVIADQVFADYNDIDTALVTLQTRSGAIVLIDNARRAVYGYDDRIELFGTGGLLESSRVTEGNIMRIFDDKLLSEGLPKDPMIRMAASYAASITAFVEFASGHRNDVPGIKDGFEALVLAEAASRSRLSGRHESPDVIRDEIAHTAEAT